MGSNIEQADLAQHVVQRATGAEFGDQAGRLQAHAHEQHDVGVPDGRQDVDLQGNLIFIYSNMKLISASIQLVTSVKPKHPHQQAQNSSAMDRQA